MNELANKLTGYGTRLQRNGFALGGCGEPVSLPLWLKERYELMAGEWLGKERTFALEKPLHEPATPGEYRSHQQKLTQAVGRPVILVMDKIPALVRDRLVDMSVPFVCPFTQVFLPEILIDLQEKYPRRNDPQNRFTPTAQLALIYHLLVGPMDTLSGKEMAELLGCSPMMAGKVRDEFQQADLGELQREGRKMHFRFQLQGHELWDAAVDRLRSPVKRSCYVEEEGLTLPMFRSSFSALSDLTLIQDDVCETRAAQDGDVKQAFEMQQLVEIEDPEMATLRLEGWSYDPGKLTSVGHVDPLSLWLSLRDDPDDRVQGELETLLEGVKWR